MRLILLVLFLLPFMSMAQEDTTKATTTFAKQKEPAWIFNAPKLINTQTVELIPKRTLAFNVTHNFGDIGGSHGGAKTFFGLDNATDVKIGFGYGLSDKINIGIARAKGASLVQQQLEFSMKYVPLTQTADNTVPLSVALYGNTVIATNKRNALPEQDNSFEDFGSRFSYYMQLMLARRFGKFSIQVSPSLVSRSYTVTSDQKTIAAFGAAFKLPIYKNFGLIMDYTHPFHSATTKDFYASQQIKFYDIFGIGAEFITGGHTFHLNFTNATEILENRFIPRTITSWGKGQFRWGFTITRDFYFRKKKAS